MKNYFKKFSIMFVMTLVIIGFGIIQNGSSANAADIGWQRYEKTSSYFLYEGSWSYTNGSAYLDAFTYNSSADLRFNFYGSKLRFYSLGRSDHSLNAVINIDGIDYQFKETTSYSNDYSLDFEKNGLELKNHSVVVKKLDANNRCLSFRAIDIDSTGKMLPYDYTTLTALTSETSNAITLKWNTANSSNVTGYNIKRSTTSGGTYETIATSSDTSYTDTNVQLGVTYYYIITPIIASKEGTKSNEAYAICKFNESISLDKSSINVNVGDTQQLTATTTPAGAQVTWTLDNTGVATVDSTGKVTGVKEGSCTITATTANGLTATCVVTVTKETKSISLNKSTTSLTIDDSETLIATTTPAGINVKWSSSDTSVATVDSNGKVTAIGSGTATITATTLDGSNLSASCLVTVAQKGNDPAQAGSEYITNIAHAKGDNTNNPGGEVTIIFHGTADTTLSVVKTADVKDVWVGDNFTYTLVITNTGTKTAKAVVVNDPAPNHIDFNVSGVTTTQGTVDSSSTSKNIIVNVGDIPPTGTVTIKIPATVIA